MNLKEAVRNYVTNMIKADSSTMKVLILDDETLKIVNSVYAMSEIMKYEVYLCEKITSHRENLLYLNCICFLRPTQQNISLLEKELRNPHYKSYNIHFSHSIEKQQLKTLADADQFELVLNVQESFADFQPSDAFLFHLNLKNVIANKEWKLKCLERTIEGVTSLLLALKICPQIRYQNSSEVARRLAEKLRTHISREATLFDTNKNRSSLLLIIDRRLDPVTPLLNQWTYQAMINELLNVDNDCVLLPECDIKEINLNPDHDEFYRKNIYNNFGEICSNIKCFLEELQNKSTNQAKIDSIEDMKKFIENYPSFRKMSTKVSQHVLIISEMSKIINANKLLRVSECEQNIVGHQVIDNHNSCVQMIKDLLGNSEIKKHDALRLVFLYALKYDRHPRKETSNLMNLLLKQSGVSETEIQTIRMLIEYGSIKSPDLFKEKTNSFGIPSNLFKSIKGVENIFTQHQCFVGSLIDQIHQMKLKEVLFPGVSGSTIVNQKPSDIIIFVIGGVTYEESLAVHSANQQIAGMNIILGDTQILNYYSFLTEVGSWVGEPLLIDKF